MPRSIRSDRVDLVTFQFQARKLVVQISNLTCLLEKVERLDLASEQMGKLVKELDLLDLFRSLPL